MPRPEDIARTASEKAWYAHAQRQLSQQQDNTPDSATYLGFDAATGQHRIYAGGTERRASISLTNRGLAKKDRVELIGRAVDAPPRTRRSPIVLPVLGSENVFRTYWCFAVNDVQPSDNPSNPGFDFGFFNQFTDTTSGAIRVNPKSTISFPSNPDAVPEADFVQVIGGIQEYNRFEQDSVTLQLKTNRVFYEGRGVTTFFMSYADAPYKVKIRLTGFFNQSLGEGIYMNFIEGLVNPAYWEPPLPPYPEPPPNLYERYLWAADDFLVPVFNTELDRTLTQQTVDTTYEFNVNVPTNAFLTTITTKVFLNPSDFRPYDNESSYWQIKFSYSE